MQFSINKTYSNLNTITIHRCDDINNCNGLNKCIIIKEVIITRYLGIIFNKNLRWDLHTQNVVGKLHTIT